MDGKTPGSPPPLTVPTDVRRSAGSRPAATPPQLHRAHLTALFSKVGCVRCSPQRPHSPPLNDYRPDRCHHPRQLHQSGKQAIPNRRISVIVFALSLLCTKQVLDLALTPISATRRLTLPPRRPPRNRPWRAGQTQGEHILLVHADWHSIARDRRHPRPPRRLNEPGGRRSNSLQLTHTALSSA